MLRPTFALTYSAANALSSCTVFWFPVITAFGTFGVSDLSPKPHPSIGRVLSLFEPILAGWATGLGAVPTDSSSAKHHCIAAVLSVAQVSGAMLPNAECGRIVL